VFDLLDFFGNLRDFVDAGGPVLRVLTLVAFLLWVLIFERLLFYRFEMPKLVGAVRSEWDARSEHQSWYAEKIRQQYVASTQRAIRGSLPTINTLIALCPMLGLLGTVTGMIKVFEVMAVLGTSNAREMASGVSAATLPTMAGMVLALSGMYPLAKYEGIVKREIRKLSDHMTLTR
jgi:biopolymer transport protein ExbB